PPALLLLVHRRGGPREVGIEIEIFRDLRQIRMDPLPACLSLWRSHLEEGIIAAGILPRHQAERQHPEGEDIPTVTRFLQIAIRITQLLGWLVEKRVRELQMGYPRHVAERPVRKQ